MKIKTLVIDDEPLVRERLRTLLAGDEEIEVIGECGNGREAIAAITELRPQLIFLDVQMPELDGFAVVEKISVSQMPIIVFVTAFDQHAVRAFDAQAFDYLLKPIDSERFLKTLDRVKTQARLQTNENNQQKLAALLAGFAAERESLKRLVAADAKPSRLMIQTAGRIIFLPIDEIDWIEPADNYVCLHTGGKSHLLRETMNGIEAKLNPQKFLRIQRSAIVNIERIKELYPLFRGAYEVVLQNGTRLKTSRGYHEKLLQIFNHPL